MEMKTLIAYYSFSGNNEKLAAELQRRLKCDILKIEELKKRIKLSILLDLVFHRSAKLKKTDTDLKLYDNIILIAPVWAGKIGTPMQSFMLQEQNNIVKYAFITLCSGVAGQREKIQKFLEKLFQRKAVIVEELWVNDLLPLEKRDKIRYTTPYRIKREDWKVFNSKIDEFLKVVK